MPNHEDEQDQHLVTLDELEATQDQIRTYQSLLKDLPEVFEHKFHERLRPVLDRQQHLLDEREKLLHQLRHSLPVADEQNRLPAMAPPPTPPVQAESGRRAWRGGLWGMLVLALLGGGAGLQLSRHLPREPGKTSGPTTQAGADAEDVRTRTVALAQAESRAFSNGDPGQWERIRSYWREGVGNTSINRPEDVLSPANPWSAVFLSYVMRKAGAGEAFPYAASHSVFISQAITDRLNRLNAPPLLAHRPAEKSPSPGDLICAVPEKVARQITFDRVPSLGYFPSRCELVVSSSTQFIEAIGGDISGAVSSRKFPAVDGKLSPVSGQQWLVVIQPNFN